MMSSPPTLPKGYVAGTHRLIAPEATLACIEPLLPAMGITRCADVTELDRIGIPVYCAIRPHGDILQLSNGKGLRHADARASALMEAIEHYHAEHPAGVWRRASVAALQAEGEPLVEPQSLAYFRPDVFYSADFVLDWVRGEDLLRGGSAWLPASTVFTGAQPALFTFTTNGLASGNHRIEATLHGLYELLERDAVVRLSVDGRVRLRQGGCGIVDPRTIDGGPVRELRDMVAAAGIKLVLISVPSHFAVHTFWAILLESGGLSHMTMVHLGFGTHLSPSVAATRAITEAAQERLTYIHGARENLAHKLAAEQDGTHRAVYAFFDALVPETAWSSFQDLAAGDLSADLQRLLTGLAGTAFADVYLVDLAREPFNVPVVRVLVPGLRHRRGFF